MPRGNGGIVEKKVSKKQKSDEWIICIHRFFCLEIVSVEEDYYIKSLFTNQCLNSIADAAVAIGFCFEEV